MRRAIALASLVLGWALVTGPDARAGVQDHVYRGSFGGGPFYCLEFDATEWSITPSNGLEGGYQELDLLLFSFWQGDVTGAPDETVSGVSFFFGLITTFMRTSLHTFDSGFFVQVRRCSPVAPAPPARDLRPAPWTPDPAAAREPRSPRAVRRSRRARCAPR
jgi:hypothetical protein